MKEFMNEYGLLIIEAIGSCFVIALLYMTFFNNGLFLTYFNHFITTMIGGN